MAEVTEPVLAGVNRRPRRLRGAPVLLTLCAFGVLAALLVHAFELGVANGMMAAGTAVLVYQVPALAFDWPRLTLDDIAAFFGWVWDMISSLWD